jgi:hypothetical protein
MEIRQQLGQIHLQQHATQVQLIYYAFPAHVSVSVAAFAFVFRDFYVWILERGGKQETSLINIDDSH